MKGKEKISESLKTGVVVVVFLLLIVQFVFFAIKIVDNLNSPSSKEMPEKAFQGNRADSSHTHGVDVGTSVASSSTTSSNENRAYTSKSYLSGSSKPSSTYDSRNRGGSSSRESVSSTQSKEDDRKKEVKFSLPALEQPVSLEEERKQTRKIDLNTADSAQLVSLYGIGPYFAKNILKYRKRLGGSFASTEQLMDIQGIDSARFVEFADRIYVDTSLIRHIDLYTFPFDSLTKHPYIGSYAAKGVERYRKLVSNEEFSVDSLVKLKILTPGQGARIKMYTR